MKSARPSPSRRNAWLRGNRAEFLAAILLIMKGYRILARRMRLPVGEIDLIARRGKVVAFVEVKARATPDAAAESITPATRRRIEAAARGWLARRPDLAGLSIRFDAVLISPRRWPHHITDAWRP